MNKFSITSNEAKLFKHLGHLEQIQQKKAGPMMVVVSPTNKCNANCVHCCFSDRDKHLELDFEELKESLRQFKELGVKGVELAGGGEPTLYYKIEELIIYVTETLGLKLGMNTNGLALSKIKNVNKFEWIRLSLNFIDSSTTPEKIKEIEDTVKRIKEGTNVTACYVVSKELGTINLDKVVEFADRNNLFTRIAPDCVQPKVDIEKLINNIKADLRPSENCFCSDFNVFLEDRPENFCAEHYIKPLLFTDGFIYTCPSFELAVENGKDVKDTFKICKGTDVLEYYQNNFQTFNHTCSYCKYAKQNELLYYILQETEFNEFV